MLRRFAPSLAVAGVVALPAIALGQKKTEENAVREPVRLTAGASSELMGVFSADERQLFYVSDASATLDLMVQAPIEGGPKALSTGLGDTAWPTLSPDGKRLAYISFRADSTGDVCLLPASGGSEKCLTDTSTAELQVLWWDNENVAVLSRSGLHGNYRLRLLPVSGGKPTTLLSRNMVGLAVSRAHRWLAYIPLARRASGVGVTFSNRTSIGIRLQALEGKGKSAKPVTYTPPLPGVTGYLAFSLDGRYLYFSQYLNDTNRDGAIDGNDNGVIFRVPFNARAAAPIGSAEPEQLSSARWNCHYPAPARTRIAITCSHGGARGGSLDVYSLPLSGAVPRRWTIARVEAELGVARDLWSKLLLLARLLSLEPAANRRAQILRRMINLHLELREYESAIHYAKALSSLSRGSRAWALVIEELAQHRRADLALVRGQTSQRYIDSERRRADRVRSLAGPAPASVRSLATLVVSEIEDDVGDKKSALKTFRTLSIDALDDPMLLPLVAARARHLFELRGDREALLGVLAALATHAQADVTARLRFSEQYVLELTRGVDKKSRAASVSARRQTFDGESELALLLDVESALLTLQSTSAEEVRKVIFALYRANNNEQRRRAIVLATVTAAARLGNEYLQYQFTTSWASVLPPTHPERKYAERLYRQVVLDRAYGELSQGAIGEARGYFFGTTMSAKSLEGHIGFVEARIAEGKDDLDELYTKRYKTTPDDPIYTFVRAYRKARELPGTSSPKAHERLAAEAIELLEVVNARLPRRAQVHQLWGFVLHQRARRQGSREAATAANRQYLLALDLAASQKDDRLRAALLHRLGLLQASLGNHRLALKYLLARDRLPHVRPRAELGVRVAIARSAWHADEPAVARQQMLAALELIKRHRSLAPYRPVVLDRLAMAHWAAGDAADARLRYNQLADLLETSGAGEAASPLNQIKARIGLAVSSIESGESRVALEALGKARDLLDATSTLEKEPDVTWNVSLLHGYQYERTQYEMLVAGLEYAAHRAAGDLGAAEKAMGRRAALLEKRLARSKTNEDRIELARAHHHLAEIAYRGKRADVARTHLESGLRLSDEFNKSTGSGVNETGLALLKGYAELHIYGDVPLSRYSLDLAAQLQRDYSFICKYRSPRWSRYRFLFELYLTIVTMDAPPAQPGRKP